MYYQPQLDSIDYMKYTVGLIVIALLAIITTSCGCNYHLKKVQSKCGYTTKTDTLTLHDTITTERTIKDTLFKYSSDTVVLKQNNLTVKYFYNTKDSTIYLQGKCDTIIKVVTKKVPVVTNVYKPNFWDSNKWFILILFIGIITVLAFRR